MGRIIVTQNNKGGVGKTSATVNLAHSLALRGKSVLVADLDNQCNATSLLLDDIGRCSMYDVLTEPDKPIQDCIYNTHYTGVDAIPNIEITSALEPILVGELPDSYKIFRSRIRDYATTNYDYTIVDTPPNMGYFVVSALYAADLVLVPIVAGSTFSLEGLRKAVNLIDQISNDGNPDLQFLRLLVNQVDRRTTLSKTTKDHITKQFGSDVAFETTIPSSADFQRAESEGKSIIRYKAASAGAKAYRSLAEELDRILEA